MTTVPADIQLTNPNASGWKLNSSKLIPALMSGIAVFGATATAIEVDSGTRVNTRRDVRAIVQATSLKSYSIDGPVEPLVTPTLMARIRTLAPLSLREWGPVIGKSHTTIQTWAQGDEPSYPKLDRILSALNQASRQHGDLATWLVRPVPGMDVRPLDLLRESRWRAFQGAIRASEAQFASATPEELLDRRRAELSWGSREVSITPDADE